MLSVDIYKNIARCESYKKLNDPKIESVLQIYHVSQANLIMEDLKFQRIVISL